ncbi:MAG TPA: 3-oxoacyl-[acyl-carrier-protein] synthase III C-terminal domain-containing protein [Candidatus Acidoferrales bacterium]|nr:3-oxoacyl-[acyl-carrier-protein] synthase III C-terminal domain-containing protein [Candidatus Acidoferrales bacterium]
MRATTSREAAGPSANGTILSVATALPPYPMHREEVKRYMQLVFPLGERRLKAIFSIVDNARIDQRYSIFPMDYFTEPRPLAQLSREYRDHAFRLGGQAVCAALTGAGLKPSDIDLFITVSCTGVMIPSVDAHLMNQLGFRPDARRLPITELGCAAGAAALAQAWQYLKAFPQRRVLVLAVELPTLTFQRHDLSQANLISCALFGDGAAAAVITGEAAAGGARMLGVESFLFPESLDAMGFDLRETGFHIILAKEVPELIRSRIKELVLGFLGRNGLRQEEIAAWVLHPGGQKLLAFVQEELGLSAEQTRPSWDVLRECGNLSSASVLFVLERWLSEHRVVAGEYGLLAGFGPGFSAEMVLLQWS